MNTKYITSADGTQIAYDYWKGSSDGILLVHQLPSNRKSWTPLVQLLTDPGYSVMAIDYRGRGESSGQLKQPEDFQNIAMDIDTAISHMNNQGVKRIIIIGASIGANHALLASQRHMNIAGTALLSPGLDYRGVKTENAAKQSTKPILIIASEDDHYAAKTARHLHELAQGSKLTLYNSAGHGTDMFVEKELLKNLADFTTSTFAQKV